MGLGIVSLVGLLWVQFSPCQKTLAQFKNHLETSEVSLDSGFKGSKLAHQKRLLRTFGIPENQKLSSSFWKGFWFLQNRVGMNGSSFSIREARLNKWDSVQLGKKEKLFRLHPGALIPLAESIGILYEHSLARDSQFSLKNLEDALTPILQEMNSKRVIDHNNGILGYLEEIRVAAFLVKEGFYIRELHRVEQTNEGVEFELDILAFDPAAPKELILVEVKSVLPKGKKSRDQFLRFRDLLRKKIKSLLPIKRVITFISRTKPSAEALESFENKFPEIEVWYFEEGHQTRDIFRVDEN